MNRMLRYIGTAAIAVGLVASAACGGEEATADINPSEDPVPSSTEAPVRATEGSPSTIPVEPLSEPDPGFLTEADTGVPFVVAETPPTNTLGRLFDYESYLTAAESLDGLRRWPSVAYDVPLEDLIPTSEGDAAAADLADFHFRRRDVTDCWAIDPPVVVQRGSAAWGDDQTQVDQTVILYESAEAAGVALSTYGPSPANLVSTDPAQTSLVWSLAEWGPDYSSDNCHPTFGELVTSTCNVADECLASSEPNDDGRSVAVARQGAWVIEVVVQGAADPVTLAGLGAGNLPAG